MSYPESTFLTRPVRRLLLGMLILCFFIISPVVIFYTAGYRYDFDRHRVLQTGVLSLNAKPRDAHITINNVVIDKNLPLRLSNRAPGTYWITLEKEGYYPWEKSVIIRSNETTYIRDVTLIKKAKPTLLPADTSQIEQAHVSGDGQYIAIISKDKGVYTILLYDAEKKTLFPLFSEQLTSAPYITWSPYRSFLLIHSITADTTSKLEIIDVRNPTRRSIQYALPTNIIPPFQWIKDSTIPTIYIESNNTIVRLSDNVQQQIAAAPPSLWYVDNDGMVWWYNTFEKRLILPPTPGGTERSIVLETPITYILEISDRRLIGGNESEIIHIAFNNDHTHSLSKLPAQHHFFDPNLNEWYVWSNTELWNIYSDGTYLMLNRSSEPLSVIRTLDDTGLLLIVSNGRLFTFHPGYSSTQEIFTGLEEVWDIGVNKIKRSISIIGKIDGKIGIYELIY